MSASSKCGCGIVVGLMWVVCIYGADASSKDAEGGREIAPVSAENQPVPAAGVAKGPRRMWAASYLWAKAPELQVEKWIGEKPDTKGKVVLIEFWATWCPPCRKSIPLLNDLQKKFTDDLVVIGISHESEKDVLKLKKPQIEYYRAIDTQARTKTEMGVQGIPHVIILEPEGHVVWEGFPLLEGYELTEDIVAKVVAVAKKAKAEAAK